MPAFQPRKNCKICKAVKADKKLFKRIYGTKFYVDGGESLLQLANETSLQYRALLTHCKKHQNLTEDALAESQLEVIAKKEQNKAIAKLVRTADARQDVIDKLYAEMDGRDLSELSGKDVLDLLLKATKMADDVAAKRKDQDIDIMKMMGAIRSGEIIDTDEDQEAFDPWADAEEGEIVEPDVRPSA